MLKRILLIAGAALYLLSFAVGLVLYFMVEGSFSIGSRYFWAYTGLPPLILALHLAAGVLLLWKPERAAPAAIAVELLFFVASLVGLMLFWSTFRWVALVAVARAAVCGVAIYYLWAPFSLGRAWIAVGAAVSLALGILWPWTLVPPPEAACAPAMAAGGPIEVWPMTADSKSGDVGAWAKGLPLAGGGRVTVISSPPSLNLELGPARATVCPVTVLQGISLDRFWPTRLNRVGLAFLSASHSQVWSAGTATYLSLRYGTAERFCSRFARSEVSRCFLDEPVTAEFYVRADKEGGGVDAVVLTHVRQPLYVRVASFFELAVLPYGGQVVRLPGLGDLAFGRSPGGSGFDTSARLTNVQPGQVALYAADSGLKGPFKELARTQRFADALVIEEFAGDRALLIYFPDWRAQALRQVSPATGEPLCANELSLRLQPPPVGSSMPEGQAAVLSVRAAVASTAAGRGGPVIAMKPGTYVNRLALRVVPKQDDYTATIQSIQLWPLPRDGAAGP